uniref:Macro domain-containing protein n=1 Tax=Pygocentrus nattereri TaxID=42514 RepID=A0AAR2LHF1_PYGNA
MTSTECIPFTVESTKILEQSHVAFCSALNGKFGCAAVFHNVEFTTTSSSGSNKGTVMPEIKYSRHLSGGLKISVWKDDLVTHKADAVVNAANEHLNHGGGLALALCRAGGPQIQQASDQIIKVQGRVATGGAVVTPAGNLPCKYIIHAVGPYVHLNPLKSDIAAASPLLDKAIQSIFRCTEFHNLQSVAIPAISSGLYNFPRDLCADIIVNAVKSLIEKDLQIIVFCFYLCFTQCPNFIGIGVVLAFLKNMIIPLKSVYSPSPASPPCKICEGPFFMIIVQVQK